MERSSPTGLNQPFILHRTSHGPTLCTQCVHHDCFFLMHHIDSQREFTGLNCRGIICGALCSLAAYMGNAREAIRRDLFAINPVLVNCDVSVLVVVVVVKVSWYAIFFKRHHFGV